MISTSIFVLSAFALTSAVGQPYYGFGGFNFPNPVFPQPGFPQFGGNFPQFGWFPPLPNNGPWVTTKDGNYQIVVKAEGYKIDDMRVKISGQTVYLRGDKMGANSNSFSYSYSIPENANANQASAVYTQNGYLITTVPLTGSAGNVERVVPITESSTTYTRSEN